MIRTLLLVFVILAVAVGPTQARGGHGSRGHHGRHQHFHHFGGLSPYLPFPYGYPNCRWEEGHWVNQLCVDRYGQETYLPQWVPGQWMCWGLRTGDIRVAIG